MDSPELISDISSIEIAKLNLKIKELENKLSIHEIYLNQALYLEKIGIWDWNLDTDEVSWYGEMFNIYGISKEEFSSKGKWYRTGSFCCSRYCKYT